MDRVILGYSNPQVLAKQHSRLGLASMALATIAVVTISGGAVNLATTTGYAHGEAGISMFACLVAAAMMSLIAAVLAAVGLRERTRRRTWAKVGLWTSLGTLAACALTVGGAL